MNATVDYCREFCQSLGHIFDSGVIRLCALTGSAATEIKGDTVHQTCCLERQISDDVIEEWVNTRLVVIDEVSFAGHEDVLMRLS